VTAASVEVSPLQPVHNCSNWALNFYLLPLHGGGGTVVWNSSRYGRNFGSFETCLGMVCLNLDKDVTEVSYIEMCWDFSFLVTVTRMGIG
jgi:hypothetical protein